MQHGVEGGGVEQQQQQHHVQGPDEERGLGDSTDEAIRTKKSTGDKISLLKLGWAIICHVSWRTFVPARLEAGVWTNGYNFFFTEGVGKMRYRIHIHMQSSLATRHGRRSI